MFAHLVPCSGGKPIALSRPQLFLGRRAEVDKSAPLTAERAVYRLRRADGVWQIDLLDGASELRVNGQRRQTVRLNSGDELALGKARYRFECPSAVEMKMQLEAIADEVLSAQSPSEVPRPAAGEVSATAELRSPVKTAEPLPNEPLPPRPSERPSGGTGPPAGGPASVFASPSRAPAPGGVLGRLVPVGGGADLPLRKPFLIVGRATSCDVCIPFRTVSSRHCELRFEEGHWRIVDVSGQNGIRIDGYRCRQGWIFPETIISIADQRFQIDYVPVGERPFMEPDDPRRARSLMDLAGIKGPKLEKLLKRIAQNEETDVPERVVWDLTEDI